MRPLEPSSDEEWFWASVLMCNINNLSISDQLQRQIAIYLRFKLSDNLSSYSTCSYVYEGRRFIRLCVWVNLYVNKSVCEQIQVHTVRVAIHRTIRKSKGDFLSVSSLPCEPTRSHSQSHSRTRTFTSNLSFLESKIWNTKNKWRTWDVRHSIHFLDCTHPVPPGLG